MPRFGEVARESDASWGVLVTTTASAPNLREDMSDHSEPRYVGAVDAARILGVSVRTVRREAAAGRVPAIRLGREWRFLVSDLDGPLTRQGRPPSSG